MIGKKEIQANAKRMRRHMTPGERIFAEKLRAARIKHAKQMVIGYYIVDFVIPSKMLIVEIDGAHHEEEKQKAYDERRTKFLKELGFKLIRIKNENVENFSVTRGIAKMPKRNKRLYGQAINAAEIVCRLKGRD